MKLLHKIKNSGQKILQLKDTPQSIAKGFALGSFIGMMPIPGFQMMVSLAIASLIKINKKAACIAVFNTNMATGLFIFAFNFWLGKSLLGINTEFTMPSKLSFGFIQTVLNSGLDVFISLVLGGVITGIMAAAFSYWIISILLKKRTTNKITEPSTDNAYTVITGASCGLGKAFAETCAKRSFNLILLSLPNENIITLAKNLIHEHGIQVKTFELDLTNEIALDEVAQEINESYRVNMLINNAGMGGSIPFAKVSSSYLDNIMLLNIRALVLLTHKLLPNIKNCTEGYILNIASMASFGPMPFKTVYPASKAFVYSFSRGLNSELKKTGITVSVAHPGGMATNKLVSQRINQYNGLIKSTIVSPERTAQICIKQLLKHDALIIPGFMNKISWLFFKICPVWLQLIIFKNSIQKEFSIKNSLSYA